MSGWLPPLTAVSSLGSELSLLTKTLVTVSSGCAEFHSFSRCLNAVDSAPVQPAQICRLALPPPELPVPHAVSPRARRADATVALSQTDFMTNLFALAGFALWVAFGSRTGRVRSLQGRADL